MALLEPVISILDETDSGLDIDALRIVASGVNQLSSPDTASILITHYQRLLEEITPDYVHVMAAGRSPADRRAGNWRWSLSRSVTTGWMLSWLPREWPDHGEHRVGTGSEAGAGQP
jgi:ABC-type transport system involved in Fe-S cluster assembly, ATPase component